MPAGAGPDSYEGMASARLDRAMTVRSHLDKMWIMALLAIAGCAHQIGSRATQGAAQTVATKLQQIEPEAVSGIVRGTMTGMLTELTAPEHLQVFETIALNASRAATRGIATELRTTEGAGLEQVANRVAGSAVATLGHTLTGDPGLRSNLTQMSREISASAVAGVRDELASVFPECSDANRKQCVERRISELSRVAARGLTAGVVGAAKLPLMGLSFLIGMLLALLVVRARRARTADRAARPPLATPRDAGS